MSSEPLTGTRPAAPPERFVRELDDEITGALETLARAAATPPAETITIADLLIVALRNELEASEEAALWMTTETDLEVKLALARQCGDEARHYRLITERLAALGADTSAIDPLRGGPSPMFRYLVGLASTAERLAAGQFTREGLAVVRNQIFIDYCVARGDDQTAALYRDTILPDERYHHELGRRLLPRFVVTGEAQERALRAARRTLELAEELQEIARLKQGLGCLPGC